MLKGKKVILRQKHIDDVENDYTWRCDAELAQYDGVQPLRISLREFMLFYADELRSKEKAKRWFAIDSIDGKHIGNCMYYDADERKKRVKLGIVIGNREYWGKGYGTDVVKTLVTYIFEQTIMDTIYLDTLEWNIRAQRCFQKCGFVTCGRITRSRNDFLVMELHRTWVNSPAKPESED